MSEEIYDNIRGRHGRWWRLETKMVVSNSKTMIQSTFRKWKQFPTNGICLPNAWHAFLFGFDYHIFFLIQFLRGSSPCNRIWHHCMDHEQLRKTLAKKAWFFLNKRSIKLCQGLSRIPKEKLQSFYVSEAKINLSPKREDFKVQTAILAKKRWLYWIRFWCTCTVRSFRTKSILLTYMGMFIWFIDDVWYAPDHCHNISNQLLLRIKTAGMPSLHSLRKLKQSLVKTLYKIPQNKKKIEKKRSANTALSTDACR